MRTNIIISLMVIQPMVFGVTRSRPLHSDESSVSVDDAESVESGQLSSTVHSSTTSRAARLRHGVGRVFQTLSIPFRKIGEVRRRRRADRRLLALRLRPVREHFVHSLPTPQPVVPLAKQKMVFYSSDGDTEDEDQQFKNRTIAMALPGGEHFVSTGCFLQGSTPTHKLLYSLDTIEATNTSIKVLHLQCDDHAYTFDGEGQGFIEIGRSRSKLDFEDPLKKTNNRAFGAFSTSCNGMLDLLRKEILPEENVELGDSVITKMCEIYHKAMLKSVTS